MNKGLRDTHIYLREEEWRHLNVVAKQQDLSISQYIRRLIRWDKRTKESGSEDYRKQLKKEIGYMGTSGTDMEEHDY